MEVHYGVLGPLEVRLDGAPAQVPGERRRVLLARLIVAHSRAVPVDVLIDDLWAGSPPAAADATLQSHVSALRRIIGADRIERVGRSYRLPLAHHEIDATLAADDLAAARLRLELGDHAEAIEVVDRALGRWRGPALADVARHPWALTEVARLDDLRAQCLETSLEAYLAAGHPEAAVERAEAAVGEYPLRERLWAHLIVGLYRSGRQVDAVRAYQRLRQALEEVGLDPGRELVALEHAVLRHDPSLDAPVTERPFSDSAWPEALAPANRDVELVSVDVAGRDRGSAPDLPDRTGPDGMQPPAHTGVGTPTDNARPSDGERVTSPSRATLRAAVVAAAMLIALGLVAAIRGTSTSSGRDPSRVETAQQAPSPQPSGEPTTTASPETTLAAPSPATTVSRTLQSGTAPDGRSWKLDARLNEQGEICTVLTAVATSSRERCEPRPSQPPFGQIGWFGRNRGERTYISWLPLSQRVARLQATTMDGTDLGDAVVVEAPELGVSYAVSYATRSEPIRFIAYDGEGRELGRRDVGPVPPPP